MDTPVGKAESSSWLCPCRLVLVLRTLLTGKNLSLISNLNLLFFSVWNHWPLSYCYQKSLSLLSISPLKHWKAAMRSSRASSSPGYWAELLEVAKMWRSQEGYKNLMRPEMMGSYLEILTAGQKPLDRNYLRKMPKLRTIFLRQQKETEENLFWFLNDYCSWWISAQLLNSRV